MKKWQEEAEERAAILQYDGGLDKKEAEIKADAEIIARMIEGRIQ